MFEFQLRILTPWTEGQLLLYSSWSSALSASSELEELSLCQTLYNPFPPWISKNKYFYLIDNLSCTWVGFILGLSLVLSVHRPLNMHLSPEWRDLVSEAADCHSALAIFSHHSYKPFFTAILRWDVYLAVIHIHCCKSHIVMLFIL